MLLGSLRSLPAPWPLQPRSCRFPAAIWRPFLRTDMDVSYRQRQWISPVQSICRAPCTLPTTDRVEKTAVEQSWWCDRHAIKASRNTFNEFLSFASRCLPRTNRRSNPVRSRRPTCHPCNLACKLGFDPLPLPLPLPLRFLWISDKLYWSTATYLTYGSPSRTDLSRIYLEIMISLMFVM